jgi:acyl transferase domain-containing protein/acyl carrier protein
MATVRSARLGGLQALLLERVAALLGVEVSGVDVHESFQRQGFDRGRSDALLTAVSHDLGRSLSPELLTLYPSIQRLARFLSDDERSVSEPATGSSVRSGVFTTRPVLAEEDAIRAWIVARLAALAGVAPEVIDGSERFERLGLGSLDATAMLADLGGAVGRTLSPTLVWDCPTPELLARHLAGGELAPSPDPTPGPAKAARSDEEPIAIVGLACRFPGAPDAEAFWALLRDGIDAVREVPADRWDVDALYDPDPTAPGKMSTRWGGFLPTVDAFDAGFFGISPREAAEIDPQQRLALELSWESLEDAGISPASLKDSRTGVFLGAMWADYSRLTHGALESIAQHTATGQDLSIVPARVSYTLGLRGPSMAINTACSSSLVAVHLARQSLQRGESRVCLAGGVNLLLAPEVTVAMSKFGGMAPDGRSKAFDARANGYVRGEGGGIVVLKRLSDALADGDRIYCVIRGSAVNNDGFSNGLSAPSPRAQEALLRDACASAGVEPADIQYVEAHGTGTPLGDPIEAGALGVVLGAGRPAGQALRIGSVKTNIGHLEAAAGIAGLIKVALSMQRREVPPSLHFRRPNPLIAFDALRLQVQTALEPWEAEDGRALAGVSAFGFGGTNAHVVVEGQPSARPQLFVLTADGEGALRARARQVAGSLEGCFGATLEAVCNAAQGEPPAARRLAVVVRSRRELRLQLEAFAAGRPLLGLRSGQAGAARRIAFVFGGHGSQWAGMGRALLTDEPAARAMLERCDRAFRRYVPWSLLQRLKRGDAGDFEQSDFVRPAIFALQMALSSVWRARGIEPSAVVGQSIGEVAAACVAGALSLDDAARVICVSSALVARVAGKGATAVIGLSAEATAAALERFGGALCIAGRTAPELTMVAGNEGALGELVASAEARGLFARRVRMDYASHSPHMDPLLPELAQALGAIHPRQGAIPFHSTVLAAPLDGASLDAAYWARNLREPALLGATVQRIADEGIDVFLELDPHPVLARSLEQVLQREGHAALVLGCAQRDERETDTLLDAAGKLFVAGGQAPRGADAASIAPAAPDEEAKLVVLSARSAAGLAAQAAQLRAHLLAHAEQGLADLAFSLATTRSPLEHRLALTTRSRSALESALEAAAHGQDTAGAARGRLSVGGPPKVVFVFPGQGSQWLGMGRQLLDEEPVFRAALEECDRAIEAEAGFSILAELAADEAASRMARIDVVQPLLFALEVALSALWRAWGVTPDAVVGHSMGEVAAAHVAGALSLEDATAIICRRSRLLLEISGRGAMAVVDLPLDEAEAALRGREDRLGIAVSNSPRSTVISGDPAALGELLVTLEARGVFCRRVKVDVASHSPQVDPLRAPLIRALLGLSPRPPLVPMRSTVTSAPVSGPELSAAYWADNLRQPVRFAEAVQALLESGHALFVEMSPHPILMPAVQEAMQASRLRGCAVGSLRRGQEERASLLESLGALWVHGAQLRWDRLFPASSRRVALPTLAWQRERHWLEAPRASAPHAAPRPSPGAHPLLGAPSTLSTQPGLRLWDTTLGLAQLPWLDDHRVQGAAVLPGAAYVEMALAAAAASWPEGPWEIRGATFTEALAFAGQIEVPVQVVTTEEAPGLLRFQIASRALDAGRPSWRVHARGALHRPEAHAGARLDLPALRARLGHATPANEAYEALTRMGLEYGPAFQGVLELWKSETEALGRVRSPEAAPASSAYTLPPALLDACFQVVVGAFCSGDETTPWVPVEIGSLRLVQRPAGELWCEARLAPGRRASSRCSADLRLVDGAGALIAEITGFVVQRLAGPADQRAVDSWFLDLMWQPAPMPLPRRDAGRFLLLGGGGDAGAQLRNALKQAGHTVVHAVDVAPGSVPSGCWPINDNASADVCAVLADAFGKRAPTAVLHLGSLQDEGAELDAASIERALLCGSDGVLATVQALARMGYRDPPRLWLLTRGAQAAGGAQVAPAQALLTGLGRVIAMEHAELRCIRVDLDPAHPEGEIQLLLAEILADDAEEEVALRGHERRVARLVHRLPETVSPSLRAPSVSAEHGALAPLLAWHALAQIDRLRAGERVLLHGAAGPTTLAALQAARALGAQLLGAAGAEADRAWLRAQAIAVVLDPSQPDFSTQVRAATAGDGVDLLLDCQPDQPLDALPSAVADDGRLVAFGIFDARPAPRDPSTEPARRSACSVTDLIRLAARRPERFAALTAEVEALVAGGAFHAPPAGAPSLSAAVAALEKRASTSPARASSTRDHAHATAMVRADGAYLITGGLGGLGLRVARWLAERGAGQLILVGREGAARPDQRAAVAALEAQGARVTVACADVAERSQVERVLRDASAAGLPLRGIIHAAGLLDDGLLRQQTPARFRAVMAPKVLGALHLDALTRASPLDFFVLYASASGLLGSPGQGNYAAANTFLDALAHHRRSLGLPALSIDWGPFSEVGLAAAQDNRADRLASRGMHSLTPDQGLAALERLLESDVIQAGVVPLDAQRWAASYPAAASSRMLSSLLHDAGAAERGPSEDRGLLDRLAASEESATRAALVREVLRAEAAVVLRVAEGKLELDAPLTSVGMDSLMGLELRNRIEARLGLRLSPTLIWQYPTIAALAEFLVEKQLLARVTSDTKSPTMAPPSAPTATAEEYEEGML